MTESKPRTIEDQLKDILEADGALRSSRIIRVTPMAGDASNREYFRAELDGRPSSMVVLRYGDSKGPQFSGEKIAQSDAMHQLSPYLRERGVPVPSLYRYDAEERIFLFEDLGDDALATLARDTGTAAAERIEQQLGSDWLMKLFRSAIDVIASYQSLPPDENTFLFKRGLAFENYRREASEFTEFFGPTRGIRPAEVQRIETLLDGICESIVSIPRKPSHFDFHGFNLLVDRDCQLRVIDFQDCSFISEARDLVSLVNDRDMDSILGRSRQEALIRYYLERLKPGAAFQKHYDLTLLHWDLRVAGRFVKLCQTKKTDRYYEWLPGTLRRLGRTLVRIHREIHGLDDMLDIVSRLSGEAREGIADPWPFPTS